jgi:glycosyltransferase involved in cell wall biosynthesis
MREKISGCITCFNEEDKIRRCLESLTWCDEIVVVDSFSTDRTVDICKEFTPHVHQHQWLGYIGQKNLVRSMAQGPWIVFLDADEVISPELAIEIQKELEAPGSYVGFQCPRLVEYLDRWIRRGTWYPDLKLRVFRKDKGRSAGREPHDHVEVDGPIKTLSAPIWHYTYDNVHDHIQQINRFSTITAQEKSKEGIRYHWWDLLFRPPWRFFKGYILRGGVREGFRGYLIALIGAFEVAIKYAKLKELELTGEKNSDT